MADEPLKATVKTRILVRTPGEIYFCDENWNLKNTFKVGDIIYIEVKDFDQNIDPNIKETIFVTLVNNKTGDKETIVLNEIGSDSGIFRGYILTNSGVSINEDGILSVISNSEVIATYTDPKDENPVISTIAYIDPYGIVFNSITGEPVPGVKIILMDAKTNKPVVLPFDPNPVTTGQDGKFVFECVPAGTYYFYLYLPEGFTFPSIIPDEQLPSGFKIKNGSRGETFTLTEGMQPLNIDIPVDPLPGEIIVKKSVNKNSVSIGDIINYKITIENKGYSDVINLKIYDTMPHGIGYLKNSSYLNGNKISDPINKENRTIIWELTKITKGETIEINYNAVVGIDSYRGDGKNYVFVEGISVGKTIISNKTYARIKISEGVFTSKGTIIGKVFIDENGNKIQDRGEKGVGNVVIYTEDGIRVVTDSQGKFSIPNVNSGAKILRIDQSTLPTNLEPVVASNKFTGSNFSQIVDVQKHGLTKANFALIEKEEKTKIIPEKKENEIVEKKKKNNNEKINFEEEIKNMTSDFAFLNLKDGMFLNSNRTNIILKCPMFTSINLYVNGEKISEKQIGKKIEYPAGNVIIYEFIGIKLKSGEKNTITAEVVDQFGNVRSQESIHVEVVGKIEKIVIMPEKDEIPADGKTIIPVKVILMDNKNNKVPYFGTISLNVSSGQIKEEDVDKNTAGHQVFVVNGETNFNIVAPYFPSICEITVYVEDIKSNTIVKFIPYLREKIATGIGEIKIGYGEKEGYDFNSWFKDGFYSDGKLAFFIKGKIFKDTLLTLSFDTDKKERDDFFREIEKNIESEEKYPIYGDESKVDHEGFSRDKLYLRIDKGMSYLMYGDYRTNLNESILSSYNRTFTGIKTSLEISKFKFHGFWSDTSSSQFVETIRGKGISGYYYLSHTPVIEGSEIIVIETRDRLRPDIVIKREKMIY